MCIRDRKESYASFLNSLLLETIRMRSEEVTPQMERAISYSISKTIKYDQNPNPKSFIKNILSWCRESEGDIPSAIYTFYAIMNRIKPLFTGISRRVFWVKNTNVNIRDLLRSNVLIDLSYLFKRNLKRDILLLINILLRYAVMLLFSRKNITNDTKPKLVIIVEEGRYIVPWRSTSSSMDTTAIEDFATLARKYGLGLITIAQSPRMISSDIIANAGTLFLMNTDIPEGEYAILDDPAIRKYVQLMPVRYAIVKISRASTLIHVKIREYHPQSISKVEIPPKESKNNIIEEDFEEYIKRIILEARI